MVEKAVAALGRLSAPPETGVERFLLSRLIRRQEALSSSGMEGTQSTLAAVLSGDVGNEQDATARQVRRYAMALDTLVPQAEKIGPDIFTPAHFAAVHHEVLNNDPDYKGGPGEIREKVVWIGATGKDIAYSTWNPPGPEHIMACLEDTAAYMRGNGPHTVNQGLILRLAIAHAHFEAVHPFLDGNGRVGRLLIPLMLAAEGHEPVYLSPWIEANRTIYYEALKAAQQRLDPTPLVGAIATGIVETEKELTKTRDALATLTDLWKQRVKLRQRSSASETLKLLPFCPVLSVRTLMELLSVTAKAAGEGIDRLVDARILEEITGNARNRIFISRDVLRIISRPFGAEPVLEISDDQPAPGEP
ncbi:Fic family protein [Gemmobacter nanjingensis]|nr:Fic family protein [Gemmobacter nanjingensis]